MAALSPALWAQPASAPATGLQQGSAAVSQISQASQEHASARVQQLAADLVEVAHLPSLSVALLDGRELDAEPPTLRFALGHENIEEQRPATPVTRYRAASVSKLFTVTVFARLVEEERVRWDASVAELVPSFADLEGATLRQLAGHLAGIAHYRGEDRIERLQATPDVGDALAFFRGSPRVGPPGAQMQYSTHGYTLLSAALEAASGASFLELVQREVAGPLGLEHTGPAWLPRERPDLDDPTSAGAEMAELYMLTPTGARPFPQPESASYKWAGGGLATTPTDLIRLARAYLSTDRQPRFLRDQTIETMWTSQEVAGEPTGTGIGWRIGEDDLGRPVRHHAGSMEGARSVLMIDPERRDAIAVMTNASWNSSIETTSLLLLDAWRLPHPAFEGQGAVDARVRIEPVDGDAGDWTEGDATWRDGALDLPEPEELKRRVRSWNTRVRVRPVARTADAGDRWAVITARGAGPGSCTEGEWWSCRFRLTHDSALRIEWRPKPVSPPP